MIKNLDIICLAETWLLSTRKQISKQWKQFQIIQVKATKKPGRGQPSGRILIAFNQQKYTEVDRKTADNCIMVKLKNEKTVFIVCCCYIREADNIPAYFSEFDEMLKNLKKGQEEIPTFIYGDFNSRMANLNFFDKELTLPIGSSNRESKDKIGSRRGRALCEEL